jgi:hypothetical protein
VAVSQSVSQSHTHTHAHAHAHTHTHTHARARTHAHAHARTCTRAHAHTHTYTVKETHAPYDAPLVTKTVPSGSKMAAPITRGSGIVSFCHSRWLTPGRRHTRGFVSACMLLCLPQWTLGPIGSPAVHPFPQSQHNCRGSPREHTGSGPLTTTVHAALRNLQTGGDLQTNRTTRVLAVHRQVKQTDINNTKQQDNHTALQTTDKSHTQMSQASKCTHAHAGRQAFTVKADSDGRAKQHTHLA